MNRKGQLKHFYLFVFEQITKRKYGRTINLDTDSF